MANDTFVIVGGGLAAARAAEGIRDAGHTGPVVIVGEESHPPYERPPLSKEVLQGVKGEDTAYAQEQDWYAGHDVALRLGSAVTSLDLDGRQLTLADGSDVPWDRLLLATGASARALDVPGADLDGVCYLRTMDESSRLREAFAAADQVVVVGAGWIGLETSAAARGADCEVTVVEPQETPLAGVVGPLIGGWFRDLHVAHGVQFRLGEGVERIEGDGARVAAVITSSGERLPADVVVVGVGITPNVALAEAAGLDVDNGILTDAALRTSADGVWAAGDVANAENPTFGTRVRVEHWANAKNQGYAAGQSMAGEDVAYDAVPYFYTDQYDAGMEYSGYVPRSTDTDVVVRGDLSGNEFMAFWLDGSDRVLAGMHVNTWDTIDAVKALVQGGKPVDRTALADPDVSLEDVTG